jgi:hypothetical protein
METSRDRRSGGICNPGFSVEPTLSEGPGSQHGGTTDIPPRQGLGALPFPNSICKTGERRAVDACHRGGRRDSLIQKPNPCLRGETPYPDLSSESRVGCSDPFSFSRLGWGWPINCGSMPKVPLFFYKSKPSCTESGSGFCDQSDRLLPSLFLVESAARLFCLRDIQD